MMIPEQSGAGKTIEVPDESVATKAG